MSLAGSVLALDVGNKRIGVAVATPQARIATPVSTITNDETVFNKLAELVKEHEAATLVIGLPRSLSGQETEQTKIVRQFADALKQSVQVPLTFQDEALTSQHAEDELKAKKRDYSKEDIDKLAATLILEDYLHETA